MNKADAFLVLNVARGQPVAEQQLHMEEINDALKVALIECDEDEFSSIAHGVVFSARMLHFIFSLRKNGTKDHG